MVHRDSLERKVNTTCIYVPKHQHHISHQVDQQSQDFKKNYFGSTKLFKAKIAAKFNKAYLLSNIKPKLVRVNIRYSATASTVKYGRTVFTIPSSCDQYITNKKWTTQYTFNHFGTTGSYDLSSGDTCRCVKSMAVNVSSCLPWGDLVCLQV